MQHQQTLLLLFSSVSAWTREQTYTVRSPWHCLTTPSARRNCCTMQIFQKICFFFKPAPSLPEYFWEQLHVWIERQIYWPHTSSSMCYGALMPELSCFLIQTLVHLKTWISGTFASKPWCSLLTVWMQMDYQANQRGSAPKRRKSSLRQNCTLNCCPWCSAAFCL